MKHMNHQNAYRAIRKKAKREGISEAQVVAEIEQAMEEMRQDAYASGDARKIALWESLPHEGPVPTAYEFAEFFVSFLQNMR